MKVLTGSWREWERTGAETAVTVGVFDGVHRGHQEILSRLINRAEGRATVVATFDPHPVAVLAPGREPKLLTTIDRRVALLGEIGIDTVAVVAFDDELAHLTAAEFVESVLVGALGAGLVVVGDAFRFGAGREGTVDLLRRLGTQHGFVVEAVELAGGEEPFSSTAARRALARSDLDEAELILGRRHLIDGVVVAGAGRGATIGIPTANLGLDPAQFLPGRGVYAVRVHLGDKELPAVCNVGVRPTFGGTEPVVEVHVLDFDDDIRGKPVSVELIQWIRPERKFEDVGALVDQINADIAAAAAILAAKDAG